MDRITYRTDGLHRPISCALWLVWYKYALDRKVTIIIKRA